MSKAYLIFLYEGEELIQEGIYELEQAMTENPGIAKAIDIAMNSNQLCAFVDKKLGSEFMKLNRAEFPCEFIGQIHINIED